MSRENLYSAIVIKKQPFGEADEIVTLYTREAGKLRVMCKAAKLPTSRLGSALQAFFLIKVRLTKSSGLAKVIGVQGVNAFPVLQQHPEVAAFAFVASEIVMRATPDEETNEKLFDNLASFFSFLNEPAADLSLARLGMVKFKVDALEALGLGISHTKDFPKVEDFLALKQSSFTNLPELQSKTEVLDSLISDFIAYQLEREIKSDKFLKENTDVV